MKSNIIIGCLYKHPSTDVSDFNKNYLNTPLDKLSKKNKQVFLLGDFNTNLLNYNHHKSTNEFLDLLLQIPLYHIFCNQLELQVTQKLSMIINSLI